MDWSFSHHPSFSIQSTQFLIWVFFLADWSFRHRLAFSHLNSSCWVWVQSDSVDLSPNVWLVMNFLDDLRKVVSSWKNLLQANVHFLMCRASAQKCHNISTHHTIEGNPKIHMELTFHPTGFDNMLLVTGNTYIWRLIFIFMLPVQQFFQWRNSS